MVDAPRAEVRSLSSRLLGRVVGSVVDPIVDQVDVGEVLNRIDVDDVVQRIDVDALIARVDVNALLDRVDPDRLLDRVDPDRLLDRVDPDRLLDRVNPDRLLDRVDPDRLLERVDADRLLEHVDVNRLVDRTELGTIITRSTAGVFTSILDLARVQVTAVDVATQAAVAHAVRRARREAPGRPGDPFDAPRLPKGKHWTWASQLQGHWAGSVSRFLAFLLDQLLIGVLFAMFAWLLTTALEVVVGRTVDLTDYRWLTVGAYSTWAFLYTAGQLAASGRTIGKAVLGLCVVRADGADLEPGRAAVRTLAFPLSFALFGAGFLVGLVRRDRRELHDLIAGTAVIYDWDAVTALARAGVVA